jgi:hypothetical protein
LPATEVDFTDDPFANKLGRTFDNRADELVARHAFETHVTVKNLQVGGADAGEVNLDQGVSRVGPRHAVSGLKR